MKKEEIHLSDIRRILFGQAPPVFLLEIAIRTALMYVILLVVVRWMGKRMKGQLTITEMAVMVTLGAMISVPMQVPDRGLLQGIFVLVCALLFQRGVSWLSVRRAGIEHLVVGRMSTLVCDGVLQIEEIRKVRLTREEIFAALRVRNVRHLGAVDRLYMEACGMFGLYKSAGGDRPGLSVLPARDGALVAEQTGSDDMSACINCGTLQPPQDADTCPSCGHHEWTKAIT